MSEEIEADPVYDERVEASSTSPVGDVSYEDSKEKDADEILPVETIQDDCRGDDKVRCGTTAVYICGVQKCDGVSNCPHGEDEENCPSSNAQEGSGEEEVEHVDETSEEPDVEPDEIGDFYFIIFEIFFFLRFMSFFLPRRFSFL